MHDLCQIYTEWCEKNRLPQWSADEVLAEALSFKLTKEQIKFLEAFIIIWDEAQERGLISGV